MDFGSQGKLLRDLRLMDCNLLEVPSSIGRLKHLRYLSLCGNPFRDLPESVGTLFNLQIIDLTNCDNICWWKPGLMKLDYLKALKKSEIRIITPGPRDCLKLAVDEGFEMKELKSLEFVSGDVEMSGLHLTSCEEVDMEGHNLKASARIRNLTLKWGPLEQGVASNDEGVMDGLRPHSNLKGIAMTGFGGRRLSSWLQNMNNVVKILLISCKRCEQLPTLGQLASLEYLWVEGMESLEVIGVEFYHNSDMRKGGILFPRLRELYLVNMQKFRDWVEPSGYELFPNLKKLEIRDCPLLSSAPICSSSLTNCYLNIIRWEAVRMILTNNIKYLVISDVLTHALPNRGNGLSGSIPNLRSSSNIGSLRLVGFTSQMSIPEWLSCLPDLEYLEIGGFNEELVKLDGAAHLPEYIRYLTLDGWPKLKCLPSELQRLNKLEQLTIKGCEAIERLPEWLGHISSLQHLSIQGCKYLKYLPSRDAMRCLTHLKTFMISNCPILEKRCIEDGEEDWKYLDDKLCHFDRFH